MAHQKSTSKKAAAAAPRTMQGKGSVKDVKAASPAMAQKPGQKKGGKRKG